MKEGLIWPADVGEGFLSGKHICGRCQGTQLEKAAMQFV